MTMQDHILAALREQLARWDAFLAQFSTAELTAQCSDPGSSVRDVVMHLWGWQQISAARLRAGLDNAAPVYPEWLTRFPGDWEADADWTNAWMFQQFHALPWDEVVTQWRNGYASLIDLGARIPEPDLLDGDRYPWLDGFSLADILIASYAHHEEHLVELRA